MPVFLPGTLRRVEYTAAWLRRRLHQGGRKEGHWRAIGGHWYRRRSLAPMPAGQPAQPGPSLAGEREEREIEREREKVREQCRIIRVGAAAPGFATIAISDTYISQRSDMYMLQLCICIYKPDYIYIYIMDAILYMSAQQRITLSSAWERPRWWYLPLSTYAVPVLGARETIAFCLLVGGHWQLRSGNRNTRNSDPPPPPPRAYKCM